MMRIIAFGASTSKQSINKTFASYAASQYTREHIKILDLNDFEVPLFSVDLEAKIGYPDNVRLFLNTIEEADLLIISMAEHNGSYTAAFKNLFDWTSRLKTNMFEGKKMILLSTSTGRRGGKGALEAAKERFPRHGAEIIALFSLPSFNENFSSEKGIFDLNLNAAFQEVIRSFK